MRDRRGWVGTLAAAAVIALAWPATAQEQGGQTEKGSPGAHQNHKQKGTSQSTQKLTKSDKKFIDRAVTNSMAEVELGRLAQEKATNPAVRQYAEQMVRDHSQASQELKDMAQSKGVQPPSTLDKKDQSTIRSLRDLSGAEFDKRYVRATIEHHRNDVTAMNKEAKRAKDPDLKNWISETLPTVENNLRTAQNITSQLETGGRGGTNR